MKKVLGIVLLGLVGFVMSVGVATFLLVRYRASEASRSEEPLASLTATPEASAERAFCPDSLSVPQVLRVVEEPNEWLLYCAPGRPARVLMALEAGQTESRFATPLLPEEYQARVSVEATGNLDADAATALEFLLAFSFGTKSCEFPGHYRALRIVSDTEAVLSEPFGECMVNPVFRVSEKGPEFFVETAPGAAGKTVRFENGAFVIAEGASQTSQITTAAQVAEPVAVTSSSGFSSEKTALTLHVRGFLKSAGEPLSAKFDFDGNGAPETLLCRDLGSVGMRCVLSRGENGQETIQTFEPRLSVRVLESKTAGWNNLVIDDESMQVWQNGKYEIQH
jgi:hypothetical protein